MIIQQVLPIVMVLVVIAKFLLTSSSWSTPWSAIGSSQEALQCPLPWDWENRKQRERERERKCKRESCRDQIKKTSRWKEQHTLILGSVQKVSGDFLKYYSKDAARVLMKSAYLTCIYSTCTSISKCTKKFGNSLYIISLAEVGTNSAKVLAL